MLMIVEDKVQIANQMKKRKWKAGDDLGSRPHYVEPLVEEKEEAAWGGGLGIWEGGE